MTYGMFLVLVVLIIAGGQRTPEKPSILSGIDTREPVDLQARLIEYAKKR